MTLIVVFVVGYPGKRPTSTGHLSLRRTAIQRSAALTRENAKVEHQYL